MPKAIDHAKNPVVATPYKRRIVSADILVSERPPQDGDLASEGYRSAELSCTNARAFPQANVEVNLIGQSPSTRETDAHPTASGCVPLESACGLCDTRSAVECNDLDSDDASAMDLSREQISTMGMNQLVPGEFACHCRESFRLRLGQRRPPTRLAHVRASERDRGFVDDGNGRESLEIRGN